MSAPCVSFVPIMSHCIYYTSGQKWGVLCLFINNQDTEEITGKRVECQKQTSQCLLVKQRAFCWAYSEVSFQDDSGDNDNNRTKQLLPHTGQQKAQLWPARKSTAGWLVAGSRVTFSCACAANHDDWCGWVLRTRLQTGTEPLMELAFRNP